MWSVTVIGATASTDDCSVGTPVGVRSDGLALNAVYPVGVTTIKWNVTDNATRSFGGTSNGYG
jgi:hypothetical protein